MENDEALIERIRRLLSEKLGLFQIILMSILFSLIDISAFFEIGIKNSLRKIKYLFIICTVDFFCQKSEYLYFLIFFVIK